MLLSGESPLTNQKSALPVALPEMMRIGAPLEKAPSAPRVPMPMPMSALPEITACWVSPVPWVADRFDGDAVLGIDTGAVAQLHRRQIPNLPH